MRADSETTSPSGITEVSSIGGSPTRTVVRPPLNQCEYCNTSWSVDCQPVWKMIRGESTEKL